MNLLRYVLIAAALSSTTSYAMAEVTRIEIATRTDVVAGKAFGDTGPYEEIAGPRCTTRSILTIAATSRSPISTRLHAMPPGVWLSWPISSCWPQKISRTATALRCLMFSTAAVRTCSTLSTGRLRRSIRTRRLIWAEPSSSNPSLRCRETEFLSQRQTARKGAGAQGVAIGRQNLLAEPRRFRG